MNQQSVKKTTVLSVMSRLPTAKSPAWLTELTAARQLRHTVADSYSKEYSEQQVIGLAAPCSFGATLQ